LATRHNRKECRRGLRQEELEVLDFLLDQPFPGQPELKVQLRNSLVASECDCGCPTIDLTVDRAKAPAAAVKQRIPVEAYGVASDGVGIHVLLHVLDGYLEELEVFREDSKQLTLPRPADLKIV